MAASRSSEAASWRSRFVTGTLSAASVRCPIVPVSSRPWRDWKRRIAAVTIGVEHVAARMLRAARSSVMASRSRSSATSGPDEPGASLVTSAGRVGQPPRTSSVE